jgi:hypothetical protein
MLSDAEAGRFTIEAGVEPGPVSAMAADLLALRRAVRELQATAKKDGCPCDQCIAIAALPVPGEVSRG